MTDPASKIKAQVAENVKCLRELHGLSLQALKELSGVSVNVISRIERRNGTTIMTVARLADALGVTAADLMAPLPGINPAGQDDHVSDQLLFLTDVTACPMGMTAG